MNDRDFVRSILVDLGMLNPREEDIDETIEIANALRWLIEEDDEV